MNELGLWLRHNASRLIVLALVAVLYAMTRLPTLSATEQNTLAMRFRFDAATLPEVPASYVRGVRPVNPSLRNIAGWVSSVGAGVAMNDLDGNGRPDDVCYVRTATNQVIIAPVPNRPTSYAPFALDPAPLRYESATMAPMGCLPGDLDENGTIDLLVYYWGRTPIMFLRNSSSSELHAASYTPHELVPGTERWFTNAAVLADLDGDGHHDLVIGNYFADGAHILDVAATTPAHMQHSMSRAVNGGATHLLLWSHANSSTGPNVRFVAADAGLDAAIAHGWTLAIGAADLDGDMLPELYFANDFGPDRLLANRSTPGHLRFTHVEGVKQFTTPSSKVLGHDSFKGMGIDFADLNGDGTLDMFVSNITSPYALEESNFVWMSTGDTSRLKDGIAPYSDQSEPLGLARSGWAWDVRLADFDNDGTREVIQAIGFMKGQINRWPELQELAMGNDMLVSNPANWPNFQPGDDLSGQEHNRFYVRAADGRYYDIAAALAMDKPQVSRGIALADADGDGRLDIAVANQWEPSVFYHNSSPHPGAFLGLQLLLPLQPSGATHILPGQVTAPNGGRPALGAVATVTLPTGEQRMAVVDGGSGHSGKRSFNLLFGLGELPQDTLLPVAIQWRDPEGRIRQEMVMLTPGWHTAVLGW